MSLFNNLASFSDDILSITTDMAVIKNTMTQIRGENPQKQKLRNEVNAREGNDIPPDLLGNHGGLNFGEKVINGVREQVMKPHTIPRITMVTGPTSAGKSTVIANRTMENSNHVGIFALNIDDALLYLYQSLVPPKHPIKELNLSEDKITEYKFDLYQLIREREEKLVSLARKLALAIVPTPHNLQDNPFWVQSSQNVITGAIIWGYKLGLNLAETLLKIQSTPLAEFANKVGEDVEAQLFVKQFMGIEAPESNKMLQGVEAELSTHIIPIVTDTKVMELFMPADNPTSENTVAWEDLQTHHIFLSVKETEIERQSATIRLILTSLVDHLEGCPEMYSELGKSRCPCLLLLDEFPLYGRLECIERGVAVLRKRNISVVMMIQSIAQLQNFYGSLGSRIILDNCTYQVLFGANDLESQRYYAEKIGYMRTIQKGYSENYNHSTGMMQGNGLQENENMELIYQPSELAHLGDELILITPEGFCKLNKNPLFPN